MAVEWCLKHPGRLAAEWNALKKIGSRFKLDIEDLKRGLITILGNILIGGKEIEIIIKYPDLYPYFRFEIYAPSLNLNHHQNPFAKNLCLLERATEAWYISDTAASLIEKQLLTVLKTGLANDIDPNDGEEALQGEPITFYLPVDINGPCVIFDSSWEIESSSPQGTLLFGSNPRFHPYQYVLKEVKDMNGKILAQSAQPIKSIYPRNSIGKWVSVKDKISTSDTSELFKIVNQAFPNSERKPGIYGLHIQEETEWRKIGDGWIFIQILSKDEIQQILGHNYLKKRRLLEKPLLIKALRGGLSDVQVRTPELKGVQGKSILLVGLGCLGAPSALEFARNGIGKLRLWDNDVVEAGTISRWPFGFPVVGQKKAECLQGFIRDHYPFCNTEIASVKRIGEIRHYEGSDTKGDHARLLEAAADGVDLIYDATAETGVQRYLSDYARERSIPYIKVSSTPGIWGGEVARILPDNGKGCWLCLYQAQEEKKLPIPNYSLKGTVYPAGCGEVTFTGTSFDSGIIALTGVRLAMATLMRDMGGYPDFDWDIAIINLRDKNGTPIAPEIQTFPLNIISTCPRGQH